MPETLAKSRLTAVTVSLALDRWLLELHGTPPLIRGLFQSRRDQLLIERLVIKRLTRLRRLNELV
jgi:hypothetical protein